MHENRSLLIIFFRNPVLGKVKTRLARTIGDDRALSVYRGLAAHTMAITEKLTVAKRVYYSDDVDEDDLWNNSIFQKRRQTGNTLGQRMENAFREGFTEGYRSICIIGTDCLELNAGIIKTAFTMLEALDAVVGPARDGGYYLLGMNALHPRLFENKSWSSSTVFSATVQDLNTLGLRHFELPLLSDVDEEKDLPPAMRLRD